MCGFVAARAPAGSTTTPIAIRKTARQGRQRQAQCTHQDPPGIYCRIANILQPRLPASPSKISRIGLAAATTLATPSPPPLNNQQRNSNHRRRRVHPANLPHRINGQPRQRHTRQVCARCRLRRIRSQRAIVHPPRLSSLHPRQHRHHHQRQRSHANSNTTRLHRPAARQPCNAHDHHRQRKQQQRRRSICIHLL